MKPNHQAAIAIAFCTGLGLGASALSLSSCASPAIASEGAKYSHFIFSDQNCRPPKSRDLGQGVIDLRNGKIYCALLDGSPPVLIGTLNLDAIPAP